MKNYCDFNIREFRNELIEQDIDKGLPINICDKNRQKEKSQNLWSKLLRVENHGDFNAHKSEEKSDVCFVSIKLFPKICLPYNFCC